MVAAFHPPPCLLSSSNIAFSATCYRPTAPSVLCLKMKGSAEEEATRMGGRKGFYVRPSKALEKVWRENGSSLADGSCREEGSMCQGSRGIS